MVEEPPLKTSFIKDIANLGRRLHIGRVLKFYELVQKDAGGDIPLAVDFGKEGRENLEFMQENEYDPNCKYEICSISYREYVVALADLGYDVVWELNNLLETVVRELLRYREVISDFYYDMREDEHYHREHKADLEKCLKTAKEQGDKSLAKDYKQMIEENEECDDFYTARYATMVGLLEKLKLKPNKKDPIEAKLHAIDTMASDLKKAQAEKQG